MSEPNDFIRSLTPVLEDRLKRNHSLNVDAFIIPSPYIGDAALEKDYEHSYVWEEEGEILGYLLVYANKERSRFHIYKMITSPFGRGKGIGASFIKRLVADISPEALVYLFVWEKHQEVMLFFSKKGFAVEDKIVYRGLTFNHLWARSKDVRVSDGGAKNRRTSTEDLGKTRHDARKTLRLLSDMVDRLNAENCTRLIEDINRETTALVNMLNAYRDSEEYLHEVDVKALIIERILPFIELSRTPCEARLVVKGRIPQAYGHYLDFGRALVNLASNALDAVAEAGRPGRITITLAERKGRVRLEFRDNGIGISADRLELNDEGLPRFVGLTTKAGARGQGIGTRQIFAAFGKENIRVASRPGRGTSWEISLPQRPSGNDPALLSLESRHSVFQELVEKPVLDGKNDHRILAALIWKLRKLEVFSWDLMLQFAKYSNIRDIHRLGLAYRYGLRDREEFLEDLGRFRLDHPEIRLWLLDALELIKKDEAFLRDHADFREYGAIMLKSYGQATDRTIIFTLDPATGKFFAVDRKLAEHLDFALYLGKDKEELLRGELSGDVSDPDRPLFLGVWSIRNDKDALRKIRLLRQGARTLTGLGLKAEKRLGFYQTTYVTARMEINTYLTTTLGEFAETSDDGLGKFLACRDEDEQVFLVTD